MLDITQNNTVWLCRTDLEKDNTNQITFNSKADQQSYFMSRAKFTYSNLSFVREPVQGEPISYLRVEANLGTIQKCNYVVYKNSSEPYYKFAFITRFQYVSGAMTKVYLVEDSFQTWQFDLMYNDSFIERMTPVSYSERNTLADDVAHGQLVEKITKSVNFSGAYFAFCSTDPTQDDPTESIPYSLQIGNYNTPCWVLVWPEYSSKDMGETLVKIANHGWGDRIMSCVYVPFVDFSQLKIHTMQTTSIGTIYIAENCDPMNLKQDIELDISSFDGYGKELTYPYAKIKVQDLTTGSSIELAPDKFENGVIKFKMQATISDTPSYKIIPMGYEGQYLAHNQSLVTKCNTGLPIQNNLYAKYMLENKESNMMAIAGAGTSLLGGALSGNPVGLVLGATSSVTQVAGVVARESQASRLGNSVTSITDGAEDRLIHDNGVKISLYTMDNYYRDSARSFWSTFGYPYNKMGKPRIGSKHYIKMTLCNVTGDNVPMDELENIREVFKKGVTLWHGGIF